MNSTSSLKIGGKNVSIVQQNNYPWDGDLKFTINPASAQDFAMLVRIPGWARNEELPSDLYAFKNTSDKKATILINGKPVAYTMENGYAVLSRTWKKGDQLEVQLPMEVRRVIANDKVAYDKGKVALQRGPLMYCAEWVDNDGKASNIIMPNDAQFTSAYKPNLLNGVVVLESKVPAVHVDENGETITTKEQTFTAIPYYGWANRGKGEMQLWFPEKVKQIDLLSRSTLH